MHDYLPLANFRYTFSDPALWLYFSKNKPLAQHCDNVYQKAVY